MKRAEHEIRSNVGKLLKQKKIDVFIGYEKGTLPLRTSPCFVSSEKEARKLIWNSFCTNNLAVYLPHIMSRVKNKRSTRVGIICKGCDSRSLVELIKEKQPMVVLRNDSTHTINPEELEKIADKIDYASVDLKDRTAGASTKWEQLIEEESRMLKILKNAGTKVFAKTVITKSSKKEDFEVITKKCSENDVPIAIQIVTPIKGTKILQPTWKQIKEFSELAGKYLPPEKIGISVQMHKSINIL